MHVAPVLLALALSGGDVPPAEVRAAVEPSVRASEAETRDDWALTLPAAIRLALDNSEIVRVISFGVCGLGSQCFEITDPEFDIRKFMPDVRFPEKPEGPAAAAKPVVIAPVNSGVDRVQFRSEVMAEVRSVEHQYWTLAQ